MHMFLIREFCNLGNVTTAEVVMTGVKTYIIDYFNNTAILYARNYDSTDVLKMQKFKS